MTGNLWGPDEDAELLDGRAKGYTPREIAVFLPGRTPQACYRRTQRIARAVAADKPVPAADGPTRHQRDVLALLTAAADKGAPCPTNTMIENGCLLSNGSTQRALDALVDAGLIEIVRHAGASRRVRIIATGAITGVTLHVGPVKSFVPYARRKAAERPEVLPGRPDDRAEDAADYIRRRDIISRCDGFGRCTPRGKLWRFGNGANAVKTDAEVVEMAQRRGWVADSWRRVA